MPKKSECRLCGDRYETINLIISESRKLTQKKYKTTKQLGEKLCRKLKFDN